MSNFLIGIPFPARIKITSNNKKHEIEPTKIITLYNEQWSLVELQILVMFSIFLMGICSLRFTHLRKVS